MTRIQGAIDHVVVQKLIDAAADGFERDGYRATSVRQIAGRAAVRAGVFYVHFPSKHAILREIVAGAVSGLVSQAEAAVAAAGDEPRERLEAAVWAMCEFSIWHRSACRIAEAELGALEPDDRRRVLDHRCRLDHILAEILADGVASGAFAVAEPEAVGRALATMCAAIASWYEPDARQVPRQIGETYCELARRMAEARPAGVGERRHLSAAPVRRSA